MKKRFNTILKKFKFCNSLIILLLLFLSSQLIAQEKVRIKLNGKEVYVFDSSRIEIKNNNSNIFIGNLTGLKTKLFNSDPNNINGRYNTFVGDSSGLHNVYGFSNSYYGANTGLLNLNGTDNSIFGAHSYSKDTTGSYNSCLGSAALLNLKNGHSNTAIGAYSGFSLMSGNQNTMIGYAGSGIQSGNNNVLIGNEAGADSVFFSMDNSICIGNYAGYGNHSSNKLFISNSTSATANPLIYGDFANDSIKIYGTLSVGDQYTFPATDGVFGQVLANNGSDALVWTSLNAIDSLDNLGDVNADYGPKHNLFGGKYSGLYNPSGNRNVAWGEKALRAVHGGSRNVAMGYSTLNNINNGSSNVAIGNEALYWAIDKVDNIAIGDSALYNNGNAGGPFDGVRNIAIGSNSLKKNTTGTSNIGIGNDALRNSQTGDWNIAMGTNALLSNNGVSNVAIGSFSLVYNTSGNKNTSIGDQSLNSLKDGDKNTSIGSRANLNNVHGGKNVTIGYQSMSSDTTGSENTVIGMEAMQNALAASNTVAVGYQAGYNTTGGGNIFLGHKAGYNETGSHNLYIDNSDTSSPLIYGDFISDSLQVNGKMRVNCTNSAYDFVMTEELNEPALIPTEANYGYLGTASNYLYKTYSSLFYAASAANYMNWSDRRLKENIQSLDGAADRIMQLQPVKYDLKEDFYAKGRRLSTDEMNRRFNQSGFIAQNLEQIYPNLVVTDENTDLKAVSYVALIPEMVSVIQVQQKKIDNLERKLEIIMELLEKK